jgi:hypothetical protein
MIGIRATDEELFSTVIAAARLGRGGPIIDRLRTTYDRDWDDPLAGFPYALAVLAEVLSDRHALSEKFSLNYTELIGTLSDVLYHLPDHWLGRYLRIYIRTLLRDEGKYVDYIVSERIRAVEDARELIERQDQTDWQPWFACSYLLAARLAWDTDRDDRDAVATLVTAAAARRRAPVTFPALGSVLGYAFSWYRSQPELPEQDAVGAMMAALFPSHSAARRARTGRAT